MSTKSGKRSDVLSLRDAVLAGATNMELAADDGVVGAWARFPRFVEMLRTGKRAKTSAAAKKLKMTNVELRPWQETIRERLDKCEPNF